MFRLRKLNIALEECVEKTRQISAVTENSVKKLGKKLIFIYF